MAQLHISANKHLQPRSIFIVMQVELRDNDNILIALTSLHPGSMERASVLIEQLA